MGQRKIMGVPLRSKGELGMSKLPRCFSSDAKRQDEAPRMLYLYKII
jgi:hypothetical protein